MGLQQLRKVKNWLEIWQPFWKFHVLFFVWGIRMFRCIAPLNLHQEDNISTYKVWHFQYWADFRPRNCLRYTKPKFAGQKLFSVVLATFFQFKSETAFRLKSISASSQTLPNWNHQRVITQLLTFGYIPFLPSWSCNLSIRCMLLSQNSQLNQLEPV